MGFTFCGVTAAISPNRPLAVSAFCPLNLVSLSIYLLNYKVYKNICKDTIFFHNDRQSKTKKMSNGIGLYVER